LPNPTHSQQTAKRYRRRGRRLARRLLNEAYAEFLRDLALRNNNNQANSSNINVASLPPSIRSFSPPSYSPISSPEEPPRLASPANSTTSSVEFIDEVPTPPPQSRHYYHYHPHQSLDTLILQFPQRTTPLPPDSYSIGPDDFDLSEIRSTTSGYSRLSFYFSLSL